MCLFVLAACGNDAPVTDASKPDQTPGIESEYANPFDFDRIGCGGGLSSLSLAGVWHLDVMLDGFGGFATVMRFDGTPLAAHINGRNVMDLRITDDDVFVRSTRTTAGGNVLVTAIDVCQTDAPGRFAGKVALCSSREGCYLGKFEGVRVTRIAGENQAMGLEQLGEWGGDPAAAWGEGITVNVRVHDGLAYLAHYGDGLRIVDVHDLAKLHDAGWSPVAMPERGEIYNDVKIVVGADARPYALMASDRRGIVVLDVADSIHPIEVATFPPVNSGESEIGVHTVFTETAHGKTWAYLANTPLIGLDVYDVTDPTHPEKLGSYVHPDVAQDPGAYLHDLYVEGGRAYLDYWSLGLVIVDARPDPKNIQLVGQFKDYERRTNHSSWVTRTSSGRTIAVTGDEDFGAHVRIVDVDDGKPDTFMTKIGEFQLRPEVSVHNIMAFGDKAYVAHYQDGVRILDLSDPTSPTLAAYFNTWDGPGDSFYEGAVGLDVDRDNGLLYVADAERGLIILRELP